MKWQQNLSGNSVSRVWHIEGTSTIIKQQPKFLTDNEIWCLKQMYPTGYVPYANRQDNETIVMEFIPNERITIPDDFRCHYNLILDALKSAGIRHGDLTEYAIRVRDNKPMLIDFAESRLVCDPRPDKRREGDEYWLKKTMNAMLRAQHPHLTFQ